MLLILLHTRFFKDNVEWVLLFFKWAFEKNLGVFFGLGPSTSILHQRQLPHCCTDHDHSSKSSIITFETFIQNTLPSIFCWFHQTYRSM